MRSRLEGSSLAKEKKGVESERGKPRIKDNWPNRAFHSLGYSFYRSAQITQNMDFFRFILRFLVCCVCVCVFRVFHCLLKWILFQQYKDDTDIERVLGLFCGFCYY